MRKTGQAIVGTCFVFAVLSASCAETHTRGSTDGGGTSREDVEVIEPGSSDAGGSGTASADAADAAPGDVPDPGNDAAPGAPADGCGEPRSLRCPCPGGLAVRGGGRQTKPCSGQCKFELRFSGELDQLLDRLHDDCVAATASLVVWGAESRERTITATLTEQAWQQLASLSRAFDTSPLFDTPCSDCEGRESAWIVGPGSDQFAINSSYAYGHPPAALREADAFVQSLIDGLLACESPLIVDCSITIEPTPLPNPDCVFAFRSEALGVKCAIPIAADRPCRAAAACLCDAGWLKGGASPQDCVDWWLAARGALTLADFCAPDKASATRSLAAALTGFAGADATTVTTSPACEQMRAFY